MLYAGILFCSKNHLASRCDVASLKCSPLSSLYTSYAGVASLPNLVLIGLWRFFIRWYAIHVRLHGALTFWEKRLALCQYFGMGLEWSGIDFEYFWRHDILDCQKSYYMENSIFPRKSYFHGNQVNFCVTERQRPKTLEILDVQIKSYTLKGGWDYSLWIGCRVLSLTLMCSFLEQKEIFPPLSWSYCS